MARRSLGKQIFAALQGGLSVVFILVLMEVWGWLQVYRPFDAFLPSWRFHHTRKPNSALGPKEYFSFNPKLISHFPEKAVWRFNSQGWLHPEDVTTDKAPGAYRIFYLGDSFTEGQTLARDSMPRLVGDQLTKLARGSDNRIEVINTGVVGYSPTLYSVLTRYKLIDFDPDLLVINIDMTDDIDEWKYKRRVIVDEKGEPVAVPFIEAHLAGYGDTASGSVRSTLWTRLLLFLYTKSYFFSYLQYVGLGLSVDSQGETLPTEDTLYDRWAWCREEWDQQTQKTVSDMFDIIRRLAAYCQRHGIRIMITAVPYYRQYHSDSTGKGLPEFSNRPHYELEKLCRELDVPYLNSYEALKLYVEGSPASRYYMPGDIHFNADGNRVWAAQQVQFLMDPSDNLLPEELTVRAQGER